MAQAAVQVTTPKTILRKKTKADELELSFKVDDYRSLHIPGVEGQAKLGICFVKVTDLPQVLEEYMEVNPRVPNRKKEGLLRGSVPKAILDTLSNNPGEMVLKNRGIYLLVESAESAKVAGGKEMLKIKLTDVKKHGIVDGGHTFAAIREAYEASLDNPEEKAALDRAYVRLHIYQGIGADAVPEIAEGLNRSKQVDDPSLANLQGEFDLIRRALKKSPGAESVGYNQGEEGEVYISEVLVVMEMFNQSRFSERKHPNGLYNKQTLGLRYFQEDMTNERDSTRQLVDKLPELMWLSDSIKKLTPPAAKKQGFEFGRIKVGQGRAGSKTNKSTPLPFIGETTDYRVPNGWLYPMLAAFRANMVKNENGSFGWKIPLQHILPDVIDDLVSVCVSEQRDNNTRPDQIGKRESAYNTCYTKVLLHLAKKGLLGV